MTIVMQRCHQRDLSGHLRKRRLGRSCPQRSTRPGKCINGSALPDPQSKAGELLAGAFGSGVEIESLKRSMGRYAVAGQLQQRPSPSGGGVFKRHWFQYWQPPGANLPSILVKFPDGTQRSRLSLHPGLARSMSALNLGSVKAPRHFAAVANRRLGDAYWWQDYHEAAASDFVAGILL